MIPKIAVPKAKVQSIDRLNDKIAAEKAAAVTKARQLARDEADGLEVDIGELKTTLDTAEWEQNQFEMEVKKILRRRALIEFLAEHDTQAIEEKIGDRTTERDELMKKVYDIEDLIIADQQLLGKCKNYTSALVDLAPRNLNRAISSATSRIKLLDTQIARPPKQRTSVFHVGGDEPNRQTADGDFRRREAEFESEFVPAARHAIEVLRQRRRDLMDLIQVEDLTEEMLAGATAEPEKVYCERLKRGI